MDMIGMIQGGQDLTTTGEGGLLGFWLQNEVEIPRVGERGLENAGDAGGDGGAANRIYNGGQATFGKVRKNCRGRCRNQSNGRASTSTRLFVFVHHLWVMFLYSGTSKTTLPTLNTLLTNQ